MLSRVCDNNQNYDEQLMHNDPIQTTDQSARIFDKHRAYPKKILIAIIPVSSRAMDSRQGAKAWNPGNANTNQHEETLDPKQEHFLDRYLIARS